MRGYGRGMEEDVGRGGIMESRRQRKAGWKWYERGGSIHTFGMCMCEVKHVIVTFPWSQPLLPVHELFA